MNDFQRQFFQLAGVVLAIVVIADPALAQEERSAAAPYRIERSTVLVSEGEYHWSQSRPALIPGNAPRVIVTTQEIEKRGSHGYRDIFVTETTDGASSWSRPARIDSLRRGTKEGVEMVMGDLCPQWHAVTRTVLVTGKRFGFKSSAGIQEAKDDRSHEQVAYAVYSPDDQRWSEMQIMAMPEKDHRGRPILEPNAGCNQRTELPNGDVLLPVRYRADASSRVYTTIVARCSFDGQTLNYREHGSEFSVPEPRGLYEPSVCGLEGRFYLTMRAESTGYVTRGGDGLNYEPPVEWKFDDGQALGSYNTQQHWITHGQGLYLVYTRRGAGNDHVFRHRAPLFIAQVDPQRLCVMRATERVLMPETGLDLGGGFGVVEVSSKETWVVSSEMAFPKERQDEPNRVLLARIVWN